MALVRHFSAGLTPFSRLCGFSPSDKSGEFSPRSHPRHFRSEMQQMVPGRASSASLLLRNAADSARGEHHLRQFCSETQQIVPGRASSASLLPRNAADSARGEHHLRHFRSEMQQIAPGGVSSASLLLRNAADSAWKSIIYVTFAQKCSRWCLEEHHPRHFCPETQQMVPGRASSASILLRNAADSAWRSIICVNFAQKRSL